MPTIDLLTHQEVEISADPSAVWPHIMDTNGWHPAQTMKHAGGPIGAVGERFLSMPRQMPDMVMLHIENVELEPGRRRTVRLHGGDERYLGYATWVLSPRGDQTSVSYHVYCRQPLPQDVSNDDLQRDLKQRTALGLQNLKRLVETGSVTP